VRSLVELSFAYEIENVLVTKNDPKFAVTKHTFRLNLMDRTAFTKIDGSKIPLNHFDFISFSDVLASEKEDVTVGRSFNHLHNGLFLFLKP
jgi:hypothetical protein